MDGLWFKKKSKPSSKKRHKSEKTPKKKQLPELVRGYPGELKVYNIQETKVDPDFAIYRYLNDPAYKKCCDYELVESLLPSWKKKHSREVHQKKYSFEEASGKYSFSDEQDLNQSDSNTGTIVESRSSVKEKNGIKSEDRRYATEAVAFFIRHSRRGVVSLCASLANLLKERDLLKQELKNIEKQSENNKIYDCSGDSKAVSIGVSTCECSEIHSECQWPFLSQCEQKQQKTIKGCLCICCEGKISEPASLVPPIQNGEKVIIRGGILGIVKYVGHIDGDPKKEIHVGLQLDVPIGNSTGTVNGKVYFKCKERCGHFTLLRDILCVV